MSQPNRRALQLIHRRKRLRQELWLAAVELVCWPVGKPGRERIEQDLHNVLQQLRYAWQHNPQHVESHILTVQRHITRIFNSQEKPTMITVQNLIEQLKHMPPCTGCGRLVTAKGAATMTPPEFGIKARRLYCPERVGRL